MTKSWILSNVDVLATPTAEVDLIPTSAKFFNPLVWSKEVTGLLNSSKVLELCTEYDKFW